MLKAKVPAQAGAIPEVWRAPADMLQSFFVEVVLCIPAAVVSGEISGEIPEGFRDIVALGVRADPEITFNEEDSEHWIGNVHNPGALCAFIPASGMSRHVAKQWPNQNPERIAATVTVVLESLRDLFEKDIEYHAMDEINTRDQILEIIRACLESASTPEGAVALFSQEGGVLFADL